MFPGGKHFGWGERAWHDGFGIALGHLYGVQPQTGGDKELGSGEHADAAGFGVENSAGAEHDLVAELIGEFLQRLHRPGYGHRNLSGADAPSNQSFYRLDGPLGGGRAHNWHNPDLDNGGKNLLRIHLKLVYPPCVYRMDKTTHELSVCHLWDSIPRIQGA